MPGLAEEAISVRLELRSFTAQLELPAGTEVLRAAEPEALADVRASVLAALAAPLGTPPLAELCRRALAGAGSGRGAAGGAGDSRGAWFADGTADAAARPGVSAERPKDATPSAVIVVSDNTRAIPYRGDDGILWPLVEALISAGFVPQSITLLVAAGTHRRLDEDEMWALFDERVREAGVQVSCHDATDGGLLTFAGRTAAGDEVFMNRQYVHADLRILTGLVQPHTMAGVSGGRKSICPGLVDVKSVRGFHGPRTLADPRATALVLDGNPCHAVALEVARMAQPDFILNVTAREDGRAAGVFAGDMEQAHAAAVAHLRDFAEIRLRHEYDVVLTHGGVGGINFYQAQKGAEIAARAVRAGGYVIFVADTTEPDPVGTASYRRLLALLADIGPEAFVEAIQADDWEFVHDQWGVQMWARVLAKVPREHLFYYSPQTLPDEYPLLPNADVRPLLAALPDAAPGERVAWFARAALALACRSSRAVLGREPEVAYLADGPHGIPVGPDAVGG